MSNFVFVLGLVFIVVVMPIALITSHKRKMVKMEMRNAQAEARNAPTRPASGPSRQSTVDGEGVEDMLETIDQLTDRIGVLEDILDENHPRWRDRQKNRQQG